SIELVTDGQEAVDRLLAAVAGARHSLEAEIYEFDRLDLADAMVAATRRGVALTVIADPTVEVNTATLARLRAAGAAVRLFPDGAMQIDHVKLLLADHSLAIFGGMNWGRGSYRNHDFDVVLTGPAVAHLEAIFTADIVRTGAATVSSSPAPHDPDELRLLTSYPDNQVRPAVLAAVAAARRAVFIEMYVLTDVEVMSALSATARRGVGVWILFDPNQELNQAAASRLRQAGVMARFYRTRGEKLHAKAMVVDGQTLVVGSANWTSSGFTRNHELDAVIRSQGLAAQALARMEADWQASA
ncbi:MAG: phosphatidylserine/phosphatidylglycerophosphate/cardiolipin synthase family protein, partial [Candidatus Dormibacteraeota bacterium]|nr:phosphatidylserine/phosphatidylglycerophosphate/cardiolipin synthase family protein [Candidatus Dormibacteraeota bacterium]